MARKQKAQQKKADKSIEKSKKKSSFDGDITKIIAAQCQTSSGTSFFWTSDKFIDSLDDQHILRSLQAKYPALAPNADEQEQKKQIIQLVNDKPFMESILSWYNIDVFDLFKLMYTYFGNVFKGPFLKKIKLEMKNKTYAATSKLHIRRAKPKN